MRFCPAGDRPHGRGHFGGSSVWKSQLGGGREFGRSMHSGMELRGDSFLWSRAARVHDTKSRLLCWFQTVGSKQGTNSSLKYAHMCAFDCIPNGAPPTAGLQHASQRRRLEVAQKHMDRFLLERSGNASVQTPSLTRYDAKPPRGCQTYDRKRFVCRTCIMMLFKISKR